MELNPFLALQSFLPLFIINLHRNAAIKQPPSHEWKHFPFCNFVLEGSPAVRQCGDYAALLNSMWGCPDRRLSLSLCAISIQRTPFPVRVCLGATASPLFRAGPCARRFLRSFH